MKTFCWSVVFVCGAIASVQAQSPLARSEPLHRTLPQDLDASEQRILNVLFQERDLNLVGVSLPRFVEFLNSLGAPTYLNTKSLEEGGIELSTPITIPEKSSIRLVDAMNLVLPEKELGWTICDNWLVIASAAYAEEKLVTKFYDVRNLVELKPKLRDSRTGGRVYEPDFVPLITLIAQTVAPDTWADAGGPGGIGHYSTSRMRVLVVSQPYSVQSEVQSFLDRLGRFGGTAPLESLTNDRQGSSPIHSSNLKMSGDVSRR